MHVSSSNSLSDLTDRGQGQRLIYDNSVRARVESLCEGKAGHLHKLEIHLPESRAEMNENSDNKCLILTG